MTIHVTGRRLVLAVALLAGACTPVHDLDKVSSGRADASGTAATGSGGSLAPEAGTGGSAPIDAPTGTGGTVATGGAVGTGGTSATGGAVGTGGGVTTGGAVGTGGAIATGGALGSGGVARATGGTTGVGGATGASGGTTGTIAPGLEDLYDSPVPGEITYSSGASWDIDGDQWPAFEIHTPTASYWLVKSAAAIVSINDSSGLQWINYAYAFRPNRGVPNLGGCCQPGNPTKLGLPTMTTEIDPAFTVSSTHLRLVSKSADASYWLVWDFFLTHFTLTINRAAQPFGFTYRGVPGGAFGDADQLVLSSGAARSATTSYKGDLQGPIEWAYLTHPAVKQSLFLLQHADDALAETYQLADGDTGMLTFGGGQLTQTPIRFSLGLISSCDDKTVRERITYVSNVIPAL